MVEVLHADSGDLLELGEVTGHDVVEPLDEGGLGEIGQGWQRWLARGC